MRTGRSPLRNERGSAIVIVAISLFVMLAVTALAVDLSAMRDARAEAQRSADAVALAGATAFKDAPFTDPATWTEARRRALEVARLNKVRLDTINTQGASGLTKVSRAWGDVYTVTTTNRELELNIIPDSQRVRAWVRRANMTNWFSGLLGKPYTNIQAMATAQATQSGIAKCIKPLALPDIWKETNKSSNKKTGQDYDGDGLWDDGEPWQFDPAAGDTYAPYDPNATSQQQALQTGYGSGYRNAIDGIPNDYGRQLIIKAQSPGDAITSGWFYPWRIGDSHGASDYRNNITGCNPEVSQLGVPYDLENGNMLGPTKQAFDDVIALDPSAHWDPSADGGKGAVVGSTYGDWRNSPRVVPIALFDPNQIAGINSGGNLKIQFNNFALFFVDGFEGNGNQAPLRGRFLYFATGSGTGPTIGPLTKTLQLVQ
jgi:hypothetical protein